MSRNRGLWTGDALAKKLRGLVEVVGALHTIRGVLVRGASDLCWVTHQAQNGGVQPFGAISGLQRHLHSGTAQMLDLLLVIFVFVCLFSWGRIFYSHDLLLSGSLGNAACILSIPLQEWQSS